MINKEESLKKNRLRCDISYLRSGADQMGWFCLDFIENLNFGLGSG